MSATKFATFLADKKIDSRRLLAVSHSLESLQVEDRAIRLAKRTKKEVAGEKKKPRSGRPVTQRALNAATTGGTISGPMKTRILKAINSILEVKKLPVVDLKTLF
jgi:hypothetical protein